MCEFNGIAWVKIDTQIEDNNDVAVYFQKT